jgi:hypothetical protein
MADSQDVYGTGRGFVHQVILQGAKDCFLTWETERNVDICSICCPLFAHTTSFGTINPYDNRLEVAALFAIECPMVCKEPSGPQGVGYSPFITFKMLTTNDNHIY